MTVWTVGSLHGFGNNDFVTVFTSQTMMMMMSLYLPALPAQAIWQRLLGFSACFGRHVCL